MTSTVEELNIEAQRFLSIAEGMTQEARDAIAVKIGEIGTNSYLYIIDPDAAMPNDDPRIFNSTKEAMSAHKVQGAIVHLRYQAGVDTVITHIVDSRIDCKKCTLFLASWGDGVSPKIKSVAFFEDEIQKSGCFYNAEQIRFGQSIDTLETAVMDSSYTGVTESRSGFVKPEYRSCTVFISKSKIILNDQSLYDAPRQQMDGELHLSGGASSSFGSSITRNGLGKIFSINGGCLSFSASNYPLPAGLGWSDLCDGVYPLENSNGYLNVKSHLYGLVAE